MCRTAGGEGKLNSGRPTERFYSIRRQSQKMGDTALSERAGVSGWNISGPRRKAFLTKNGHRLVQA